MADGAGRSDGVAQWPSRRVALALLAGGAALYAVRTGQQLSGLSVSTLRWDFVQFHQAAALLNSGHSPYAGIPTGCGTQYCQGGYWYPTLLAVLMRPLGALPVVTASIPWIVLVNACLWGALWLTYRVVRETLSVEAGLAVVGASLLWFPLYESLGYLQLGTPLLLLLLLAARSVQAGGGHARTGGGATLAVAGALKVSPLAACAALIAPVRVGGRRDVDRRAILEIVAALVLLVGIMVVATPSTIDFVTSVMPRLTSTPTTPANVSLISMVRELGMVGGVDMGGRALTAVVAGAIIAATLAGVWRMSAQPRDATRARLLALAALTAAMPLTTSITWTHHVVTDLVTLVIVVGCCCAPHDRRRPEFRAVVALAAAGYVLAAMPWGVVETLLSHLGGLSMPGGATGLAWTLAAHVGTVGAVLIWVACMMAMSGQRAVAGERPSPDTGWRTWTPGEVGASKAEAGAPPQEPRRMA